MTELIQNVIDSATLGCLYALLALGVAVIFGVARIVNFAHGELIAVAGYVMLIAASLVWPLVALAAVAAAVILALLLERVVFRPIKTPDPTTLLVAAFAASQVIQSALLIFAGSRPKTIDFGGSLNKPLEIGSLNIPKLDILTLVVTAVLLVGLVVFFRRTMIGIQLRATAHDIGMARLLGVPAHHVVAVAFAISGVLAAVASILLTTRNATLTPEMGLQPVLIAFTATVIGGLGSLPGAALGGFFLGVLTVVLQNVLPSGLVEYREGIVFSLVIVVLLVRPNGLLSGTAVAGERV